MNKLLRGLVLVGAVLLVFVVIWVLAAHTGSRGALQRFKTELRAQGEKLSFAEFPRGQAASPVDSHAVITNCVTNLSNARFNPGLLEGRTFVRPGQAEVT